MSDQLSFASLDYAAKKKRTKREVFLAEMAAIVPWPKLEALIEPHYPKLGPQGGRRPFPLPVMLRIYCLQQWYNLSDPGAEEALYDIQSMRAFAGIELGSDAVPDETTILNFRHLLERHDLTKAIFEGVAEHLSAKGELLRGGTIVDATLIAASHIFSGSTQNPSLPAIVHFPPDEKELANDNNRADRKGRSHCRRWFSVHGDRHAAGPPHGEEP